MKRQRTRKISRRRKSRGRKVRTPLKTSKGKKLQKQKGQGVYIAPKQIESVLQSLGLDKKKYDISKLVEYINRMKTILDNTQPNKQKGRGMVGRGMVGRGDGRVGPGDIWEAFRESLTDADFWEVMNLLLSSLYLMVYGTQLNPPQGNESGPGDEDGILSDSEDDGELQPVADVDNDIFTWPPPA